MNQLNVKEMKGKKWDGRSRPATERYKKNYNDIFKNPKVKKIKKSEYESIAECIISDQVSSEDIVEYFKDKRFYKFYQENYIWIYARKEKDDA